MLWTKGANRKSHAGRSPTVLFAGGGTGGHIYPNLAVWERLREAQGAPAGHFVLSDRPLDGRIVASENVGFTPLGVRPWPRRPWQWPGFLAALARATRQVRRLIDQHQVRAVVATGGYVAGPVLLAARRCGVPAAMVNLDAVPGRANSRLARQAARVFTVYASPHLPGATTIGLPMRRCAVGPDDQQWARRQLGLDPQRPTLMITGGSQGAQSVNEAVLATLGRDDVRAALAGWQVLHITGPQKDADVAAAYQRLGMPAIVTAFCDAMGLAWRAATLAVSRAGAGAVAEAWANAAPTLFLPYPFHKDQHQRLNAQPLVTIGGAELLTDRIDPAANAAGLAPRLIELARDEAARQAMAQRLTEHRPIDGAELVARWVTETIKRR